MAIYTGTSKAKIASSIVNFKSATLTSSTLRRKAFSSQKAIL